MPSKQRTDKCVKVPKRTKTRREATRRSQRLMQKMAENVLKENEEINGEQTTAPSNPPAMAKKEEGTAGGSFQAQQPVVVDFPRVPIIQIGDHQNAAANQQQQQVDDEEDGNDVLMGSVPVTFYGSI